MKKFELKPTETELEEYPDFMDDLTGNIIFSLGEIEEDALTFYCGPETKEGYLLDWTDCGMYAQLEELFKSVGMDVNVGSAENFHTISFTNGESGDEVWNQVKNHLILTGAKEKK